MTCEAVLFHTKKKILFFKTSYNLKKYTGTKGVKKQRHLNRNSLKERRWLFPSWSSESGK